MRKNNALFGTKKTIHNLLKEMNDYLMHEYVIGL